ncbi:peptidase inhibitor family I36 protein [Saccharopolyspora sp. SCSIO 74807]|uniref:peptidase inhibitor family I36 protein n=1 Tax=Saccharopolyspora sp. SCSIO 74807 TaxID=3118084 RepID=UPI0030D191BB
MFARVRMIVRRGSRIRPFRTSRVVMPAVLLALGAASTGLSGAAQAEAPAGCGTGTFCAYPEPDHRGEPHRAELRSTTLEQCMPLPARPETKSFVNNTGKPVTVYQDPECDTHADFATYPTGTFVPGSDFVARAIKVWPR